MSYTSYANVSTGEKRKEWTIKLGASYLSKLLDAKVQFISGRIAYWINELDKAKPKPKAERVDALEVADDDDYKPTISKRAAYCKDKLSTYSTKLKEATEWQLFFNTAGGGDEFAVTLADALYFGLKEYQTRQQR